MFTHHVSLMVMLVFDDEDHVESRQNGGHEVNVVPSFCIIPTAEHGVGSGQYRAAGVQSGGDASLEVNTQALIKEIDQSDETVS